MVQFACLEIFLKNDQSQNLIPKFNVSHRTNTFLRAHHHLIFWISRFTFHFWNPGLEIPKQDKYNVHIKVMHMLHSSSLVVWNLHQCCIEKNKKENLKVKAANILLFNLKKKLWKLSSIRLVSWIKTLIHHAIKITALNLCQRGYCGEDKY